VSKSDYRLEQFKTHVWDEGKLHVRELPWRNLDDPYAVYVSEVMLQQTQVSRVLNRWDSFMRLFPTIDALSSASTSDLLTQWQGMGYNRRALAMKHTADICSAHYGGTLPNDYDALLALPGIGPSTAAGIRAFAFNEPGIYLETNVRTVFLHELFPDETEPVSDTRLRPLVEQTCSQTQPRAWYYALLDFGAYLKKSVPNPSRRSAQYHKQSRFEGSRRQKRAELVRIILSAERMNSNDVLDELNVIEQHAGRSSVDPVLFDAIVSDLIQEGFLVRQGSMIEIIPSV
jgi:A/G-specific adenine glycosylase